MPKLFYWIVISCTIVTSLSIMSMQQNMSTKELEQYFFNKNNWKTPDTLADIKKIVESTDPQILKALRNLSGNTILHQAAEYGNDTILQVLINKISDKEWLNTINNQGDSALIAAFFKKPLNITTVKILLQNGINPNITSNDGQSALAWAAEVGTPDLIDLMVKNYNAHVNDNKFKLPPLIKAVFRYSLNNVKKLLELGANPNSERDGRTALYWAIYQWNNTSNELEKENALKIAHTLLKNGADQKSQPFDRYQSPQMYWRSLGLNDNLEIDSTLQLKRFDSELRLISNV